MERHFRPKLLGVLLLLAVLALSACVAPTAAPTQPGTAVDEAPVAADTEGPVTLRYNLATEPPAIDPALSTDTTSSAVIRTTMLGLTKLTPEDSAAEPSLATDWTLSEDELTWTFTVRTDVPWVQYNADSGEVEQVLDESGNPRFVTAGEIANGMRRSCDAETASNYAYIMFIIEGCEAANSGEGSVDDIAVSAPDDSTLEVTTVYPASFFPQIASMPTTFPVPMWVIEEHGDSWTEAENIVANGPFAMAEWIHSDSMTLVRNPFWPGWTEDDRVGNIDRIEYVMIEESSTEFALYENNELDDASVPLDQMQRVFGEGSEFGDQGQIAPSNCTYVFGFVTEKEAVSDPAVRRALSMAVDRMTLVEQVTQGGQQPANAFTNPANFGSAAFDAEVAPWALPEDMDGTGYAAAVEMAQELMAEAGYEDGAGLNLTLSHNVSEGHARIAQAIQAMWTAAFPQLQVSIETQEWGVFLDTLEFDAPLENKPDVYRYGWCADYPHANNWLHEVFNPVAGANSLMLSDEDPMIGDAVAEYTQLTFDAQTATPEEAEELYKQAEQLLIDEMAAVIPIYFYTTVRATKPWLDRIYANDPYFEFWSIDTSAQEGM